MNVEIDKLIAEISEKTACEMMGDGTHCAATSQPSLTADVFTAMMKRFGPAPKNISLIEVEPMTVQRRVKTHRRRRIDKKWRKRYGWQTEYVDLVPAGQVIVDEKQGVGYCNVGDAARLRNMTMRSEIEQFRAMYGGIESEAIQRQ